jgi:hypothetical protein
MQAFLYGIAWAPWVWSQPSEDLYVNKESKSEILFCSISKIIVLHSLIMVKHWESLFLVNGVILTGTISRSILWNFCCICIPYCKLNCISKFKLTYWRGICLEYNHTLNICTFSSLKSPAVLSSYWTTMAASLYLCCADSHHSIQNSTA